MANFDELLDLVVESAVDDGEKLTDLNRDLKSKFKELKIAIRNKDSDTCKKCISEIEDKISDIEKVYDELNPDEYPDNTMEAIIKVGKIALGMITAVTGTATITLYNSKNGENNPSKVSLAAAAGASAGTAALNQITTIGDMKKEIKAASRQAKDTLDKLRKKCTKKGLLKDSDVKESVNETKLAIYESCHAGEITEAERDILLGIVE